MWSIIRGTTLVADLTLVPSHAMKVCCCCTFAAVWTSCTVMHTTSSNRAVDIWVPVLWLAAHSCASAQPKSSCARMWRAASCAWLSLSGPQHSLPLLAQALQSSKHRSGAEAGRIGCLLWRGSQCLCLCSARLCSQASAGKDQVHPFDPAAGLARAGWQLLTQHLPPTRISYAVTAATKGACAVLQQKPSGNSYRTGALQTGCKLLVENHAAPS